MDGAGPCNQQAAYEKAPLLEDDEVDNRLFGHRQPADSHRECGGAPVVRSLAASFQSFRAGPELLPGQSLPSFANFRFGRAQADSIVEGDRLTQFMYVMRPPAG